MPAGKAAARHAGVSANHASLGQNDARSSIAEGFDGAGGLIGRIHHAAHLCHGTDEESQADKRHNEEILGQVGVKALCPSGDRIRTGVMELMMFYAAKSASGRSSTVGNPKAQTLDNILQYISTVRNESLCIPRRVVH